MFLYLSAITEVGVSALLTVFLSEPMFTFDIYSCGVSSLSDWYTYFFNPSPRYESTLVCTAERVYPLQTMVLIFYVFCVTSMLLLRPFVNEKCKPKIEKASLAVYYALYAFPLLALIHSLFGGLVYFAFPYLSIIISCGANAGHFAMKLDQSAKSLLITSVTDVRNVIIIGEPKNLRVKVFHFYNRYLFLGFSWQLALVLIWNRFYKKVFSAALDTSSIDFLHRDFKVYIAGKLLKNLEMC